MSLDFRESRTEVREMKRKQDGFEPLPYTQKFLEVHFSHITASRPQTQDHLCKLREQNVHKRKMRSVPGTRQKLDES